MTKRHSCDSREMERQIDEPANVELDVELGASVTSKASLQPRGRHIASTKRVALSLALRSEKLSTHDIHPLFLPTTREHLVLTMARTKVTSSRPSRVQKPEKPSSEDTTTSQCPRRPIKVFPVG